MATVSNRILLARIAGQSGLVTRRQALDGGLSRKAIEWRLGTGRWTVVHPGVYLTTPGRSDWDLTAVAALLWAGPGAALFGRSAARAWSLVRRDPAVIEVVIPPTERCGPERGSS
jgi:hypothetical protein